MNLLFALFLRRVIEELPLVQLSTARLLPVCFTSFLFGRRGIAKLRVSKRFVVRLVRLECAAHWVVGWDLWVLDG